MAGEAASDISLRELLQCRSHFFVHHPVSSSAITDERVRKRLRVGQECSSLEQSQGPDCSEKGEIDGAESVMARLLDMEKPSFVTGRLQLWNRESEHCSPCSLKMDCLAFSDGFEAICCIARDFNPRLLGHPVRLMSWNYIPMKNSTARLEVRSVEPLYRDKISLGSLFLRDPQADGPKSRLETFPRTNSRRSRVALAGCTAFISPPFAVANSKSITSRPASNNLPPPMSKIREGSGFTEGFFLKITACNHLPRCPVPSLGYCVVDKEGTASAQAVSHVYFSGSVAAWRPILVDALGRCIFLTNLQKRALLLRTEQKPFCVYTATSTTAVSFLKNCSTIICKMQFMRCIGKSGGFVNSSMSGSYNQPEQRGIEEHWNSKDKDIGSYVGIVTGVFGCGRLVELDDRIWLLLTHQPLSQVHGLRVGALIAARHVHFLKLSSLNGKTLLLAACSISSAVVVCFSSLKTFNGEQWEKKSFLSQFIDSLPSSLAFWALQVCASFRRKFNAFYSEREILGTAKTHGLAEKYARDLLSVGHSSKRDVYKEFFSYSNACFLARPVPNHISAEVPPIANFCMHIQLLWHNPESVLWCKEQVTKIKSDGYQLHQPTISIKNHFQLVLCSKDLGVVLVGFLQFCKKSGRLQLFDSTGAINVVIPDLKTLNFCQKVFQISVYKLVVEGCIKFHDSFQGENQMPLCFANILKGIKCNKEMQNAAYLFLVFNIKQATILNLEKRQGNSIQNKDSTKPTHCLFEALNAERIWSIVLVVHKHPLRSKECNLSFAVEGIRLPYGVYLQTGQRQLSSCPNLDRVITCTAAILSDFSLKVNSMFSEGASLDRKSQDDLFCYTKYSCLLEEEDERNMERKFFQFVGSQTACFEFIQCGSFFLVEGCMSSSSQGLREGNQFWSLRYGLSFSEAKHWPVVDIFLEIPQGFLERVSFRMRNAETYVNPLLSVRQVTEYRNTEAKFEDKFSVGSLISLHGVVESFHCEELQVMSRELKRTFSSTPVHIKLDIRDIESLHVVQFTGDFDGVALPLGLGAGSIVTIYRALIQSCPNGNQILCSVPSTLLTTCIVEGSSSSLNVAPFSTNMMQPSAQGNIVNHQESSLQVLSIYEIAKGWKPTIKMMKLRCRVVAVERLLLAKEAWMDQDLGTWKSHAVQKMNRINKQCFPVSYASFILDDGSGLAHCWATGSMAAQFLVLTMKRECETACIVSEPTGEEDVSGYLNSLVRQYEFVSLQNIDWQMDFPNDAVLVVGSKNKDLTTDEKKVFLAIVKKVCNSGQLEVTVECQQCEDLEAEALTVERQNNNCTSYDDLWFVARKVEPVRHELHLNDAIENLSASLDANFKDTS